MRLVSRLSRMSVGPRRSDGVFCHCQPGVPGRRYLRRSFDERVRPLGGMDYRSSSRVPPPSLLVAAAVCRRRSATAAARNAAALATHGHSVQVAASAYFVGLCSIVVGIAGLLWHLNSQFFVEQTLKNLVYAAPFVAPLAYSGIGVLASAQPHGSEWLRRMAALGNPARARRLDRKLRAQSGRSCAELVLLLAGVDSRHRERLGRRRSGWWPLSTIEQRVPCGYALALMAIEIAVGVAGWALHLVAIAHSPMGTFWERAVFARPRLPRCFSRTWQSWPRSVSRRWHRGPATPPCTKASPPAGDSQLRAQAERTGVLSDKFLIAPPRCRFI